MKNLEQELDGQRQELALKDNALYPLLHFVLDNLPQSTKAPELDDRTAVAALKFDCEHGTGEDVFAGKGITEEIMGVYLAYLVEIGFLDKPGEGKRALPAVVMDDCVMEALLAVGGRGGIH
ncbi:hypothetical protein V1527DRAFT_451771 [Lipomyces starkeyi]